MKKHCVNQKNVKAHSQRIVTVALFATVFIGVFFLSPAARACHEGHLNITFRDSSRNRDIDAIIYYNADRDSGEAQTLIGTASNSIPQFSVIALGHGYQIPWSCYHAQAFNIILNFYTQVVIVPKTGDGITPNHTEFARDMVACLKYMQDEGSRPGSLFYGHIKNDNTLMGHSMGGGCAVLAAKYAIQNTTLNVSALIQLAPAETTPSALTASASVNCPTLVICGDKDCVTPLATVARPIYDALPIVCKSLVTMPGASHCQFADSNTVCSVAELSCRASISRTAQQNRSFTYINNLLKRYDLFARTQDNSTVTTAMTLFRGNDLTASKSKVCVGDTVVLQSKVALPAYLWLPDSVTTPTYTFIPKQGSSHITLVNQQCFGNTSASITITAGVTDNIRITGANSFCAGDSVRLVLTNDALTQPQWSTGETTQAIAIRTPGTYTVKEFDAAACAWTSELTLKIVELPFIRATLQRSGDTSFCAGLGEVKLECNVDTARFKTYQWSTGETTPYIILRNGGTHKVWARVHTTAPNLCDAMTDTMTVELHEIAPPKPTLTRVVNTLVASEGDSYTWYKGGVLIYDAKVRSFSPYELGKYSVRETYHSFADCGATSEEFNFDQHVDVTDEPFAAVQIAQRESLIHLSGLSSGENLRLISCIGTVVRQCQSSGATLVLDCSDLSSGVYYLHLQNRNVAYKMMLQR